ncbi:MBL fold metallo-hydrolase [Kroppenstedtia eburnea]|uniref:Glyoxylase, beta-lactamase superfamily II n=1 Tax=Kroppenstedtia eburnea TaxID=714067 RepID=A0A1N7ME65_9BACL|nr:MBL fold metallo-hydrolase [Kroppenstedtia eburnea]QKI81518.1 MBL fold metallo-hydrolase [Kroppenstedtia eburnea]SIS84383.1 Glyoxylase, beta-lactamase superfamily II [Kroppenstedtia eburnea]
MEMNRQEGMEDPMANKYMPMTSVLSGTGQEVLPDLYCYTDQIVNLVLVGNPDPGDHWVLVDTGMPGTAHRIVDIAEKRFGENSPPQAIILTHGHFDHVGTVVDLVEKWGVPVYAHEAELPFLTGKLRYPEPDGSVEGGLVAKLSPMFPNEPVNLGSHVTALPGDGSIPHMSGWRWIHTPGHTPGHISLFRDQDRSLIAGDALITVKQDSLYQVITQEKELNGPPRYLTTDWNAAKESVKKLAALKPAAMVTGHGHPLSGKELAEGLDQLVREFDSRAIPDYGRYVKH